MTDIYFDNSATTALCEKSRDEMIRIMELYGNPSSLHSLGVGAQKEVCAARNEILASIGVRNLSTIGDNRLIFTSSGTEADNLALFGVCHSKKYVPGKKIIISDSEHPAVLECAKKLEDEGYAVVRIPTVRGVFDFDAFEKAADKNTVLVSVMLVNNETGAVNDIKRISAIAKAKNPEVIVHTDAVQGFLKMKFTPASLGADLITLSAHKVHGPKGVGALYVDPAVLKARKLVPVIYGGGQEKGFRSGTENTIGIIGFAAAVKEGFATLAGDIKQMCTLRDYICERLKNDPRFDGFSLNMPEGGHAPHIISVTLPNIKSETMLHYLSKDRIYVSSGSACSSNTGHISGTLVNFGLTENAADSTVRISLCPKNTQNEADKLLESLYKGSQELARAK